MRRVYKFPIVNETPCPSGRLTHFGLDPSGVTCVWIAVDPDDLEPTREYAIVGTGHTFPDGWFSAGLAFVEGQFIWHLIERMLHVVEEPLADWERALLAEDALSNAIAERDRARDIAARLEGELARVRDVVTAWSLGETSRDEMVLWAIREIVGLTPARPETPTPWPHPDAEVAP